MIETLKKIIVIEVLMILFFFVTGFVSLYFDFVACYLTSVVILFFMLFVFYRTIVVTLKLIESNG